MSKFGLFSVFGSSRDEDPASSREGGPETMTHDDTSQDSVAEEADVVDLELTEDDLLLEPQEMSEGAKQRKRCWTVCAPTSTISTTS